MFDDRNLQRKERNQSSSFRVLSVASILARQESFHARLDSCINDLDLLMHASSSKGRNNSILSFESFDQGSLGVVRLEDFDVGGILGCGFGASKDGDVEFVAVDEGFEDGGTDGSTCLCLE